MKELTISEVTFYPVKPTDKGLIGFASCLFDNRLSLNSIAVYTRPSGDDYRLVFPSKYLSNGKEINIFYPVCSESYELIKKAVIEKIEKLVKNVEKQNVQKEM